MQAVVGGRKEGFVDGRIECGREESVVCGRVCEGWRMRECLCAECRRRTRVAGRKSETDRQRQKSLTAAALSATARAEVRFPTAAEAGARTREDDD